jgi:redox-sensitive bicupin YhaK (pirin superfamily)
MHIIRRANDRGVIDRGWLQSRHTFSFGDYYDADHMGFGPLRVINEDRVAPGVGFNRHPHRHMDILSWVLSGTLEHQGSLGTGSKIGPGDIQRMTAGTGISHSEFNASTTEPLHFLQIWIVASRGVLAPEYQQLTLDTARLASRWQLIATCFPTDDAVTVHQDVDLYATRMAADDDRVQSIAPNRLAWLQIVRGEVEVDGLTLFAGDGAAWIDPPSVRVRAIRDAELLLFDMTPGS